MASRRKSATRTSRAGYTRAGSRVAAAPRRGAGFWALIAAAAAIAALVVGIAVSAASGGSGGWTEKGIGGTWTNVDANTLAGMMAKKDFTLVNVKTPYIGEIQGTDLYIPYTDLASRSAELPADKAARVVVYCRSGNESRIAAQTLLDLGYTNIWNLDKGMESWTASGRSLVQENHT